MKNENFVSVAIISYDKTSVEKNLSEIEKHLRENFSDYEIIILGKQSNDSAFFHKSILCKIPCIRYLEINSYIDDQLACSIALDNAIGDYLVFFNPQSDPVPAISSLIGCAQNGYDIVAGKAAYSQSLFYRIGRFMGRKILMRIGYIFEPDTTGLVCLTRRAINAVINNGRYFNQFFVSLSKTGLPIGYHNYQLKDKAARKKTFNDGLTKAFNMLIFNSTRPLRWVSYLGFAGSLFSFIFALYSVIIRFFKHDVIEGWTSTMLVISFLFMFLFVILAFFGEYLGRILDENQSKEAYVIAAEHCSNIMIEEDRLNVYTESEQK